MAKPAPEYELILMLDPEMPDERRDQIAVDARKRIEGGADLKQERSWGLRKMAYEIKQRNEADYRFFRFGQSNSVLDDLNHNLKITDGVLRFRIFKVEPDAPVIDPPPPFSLAATSAPRPGGRRRDDDRPPRAPEPEPESSAGEAVPAPSGDAEAPAADAAPAEQPPAPDAEQPAAGPAPDAEQPAPIADTGSAPQPEDAAAEPEAPAAPEGDDQQV